MPPDQIYQPMSVTRRPKARRLRASELSIVDPAEFRKKPDDERDDLTVEDAASQHRRRPDP